MLLIKNLRPGGGPGGKHGIARGESRDPIGYAVAALNRLARSDLLDRIGLRRQAEQTVFTVTRGGVPAAAPAGGRPPPAGGGGAGGGGAGGGAAPRGLS